MSNESKLSKAEVLRLNTIVDLVLRRSRFASDDTVPLLEAVSKRYDEIYKIAYNMDNSEFREILKKSSKGG